ncbi:hypothetical protein SAMN05216553_108271 [Lentzea fradiae]|uniref:Sporulation and spore germination n=1 Tax=Lentzea fradiae TaxID=200378 RepID=A0A1G7ULP5_9PSEU|nr:GerMN domain-containing protein [Lentzea fradiae]SDG48151.1 hypothetical protein SAMN05216553_108271 [Lentzea fradiae]
MRLLTALLLLVVAGCGVRPSGVTEHGEAPTGVAPGVTLYFLDDAGGLRPSFRETERLGSVSEALSLLLTGPGTASGQRTGITSDTTPRVVVVTKAGLVQVVVPLALSEVTPRGIDQIVCTTLAVHVQSGGDRSTKVQVRFTQPTPESEVERTCPVIS